MQGFWPIRAYVPSFSAEADASLSQGPDHGLPVLTATRGPSRRIGDLRLTGDAWGAAPATRPAPADIAVILHSSGTTGRPKLVPRTHRNLVLTCQLYHRHQGDHLSRSLFVSLQNHVRPGHQRPHDHDRLGLEPPQRARARLGRVARLAAGLSSYLPLDHTGDLADPCRESPCIAGSIAIDQLQCWYDHDGRGGPRRVGAGCPDPQCVWNV